MTKFCQGNEEERTGWSRERFVFLFIFFQNKTDLYLKKLEERGRMQCGKGKEYTCERKYPVGVIKGENYSFYSSCEKRNIGKSSLRVGNKP